MSRLSLQNRAQAGAKSASRSFLEGKIVFKCREVFSSGLRFADTKHPQIARSFRHITCFVMLMAVPCIVCTEVATGMTQCSFMN